MRDDERVRRNVGLAGAEERSFYWRLTAEENLLFFARLYGLSGSDAQRKIQELFQLFEFDELARRRFAELPTGNKQRLAVARAMLANPPVLLLDEPTRSLDPIAAARMRETIQSLAQNEDQRVTIFLTSHNLAEVEELCDRVAIISKGEIRAIDSPANLRATHTQQEEVLSFAMVFKRGEPFGVFLGAGSALFSGVFFPTQLINQYAGPGVAGLSRILPPTYGLEGIRRVLIEGEGFAQVREPFFTLMIFLAVLLPFSLWVFKRAVRRAKREGSLIQY